MEVTPLEIEGTWLVRPRVFADDRGSFHEWLRQDVVRAVTGRDVVAAQANCSVSKRGVLRGVHFTDVPPGQAKYVTCLAGAVLDIAVDVRVGSPTYGQNSAVELAAAEPACVLLAEGLGHAFMALTDDAVVAYVCSTTYDPVRDREVHPLDPELALPWPSGVEPLLSAKDAAAPTLREARERGILPSYAPVGT